VLGDVRRVDGIRRLGKVVSEGELDPGPRPPDPHHDQAAGGMEAEQVRHDGQDVSGGTDPYPGLTGERAGT
jgi:hypothetical protein